MPSSNPYNPYSRVHRKNSKNIGEKTQILTKDGLKPIGSNGISKKKVNSSLTVKDSNHLEGMMAEARGVTSNVQGSELMGFQQNVLGKNIVTDSMLIQDGVNGSDENPGASEDGSDLMKNGKAGLNEKNDFIFNQIQDRMDKGESDKRQSQPHGSLNCRETEQSKQGRNWSEMVKSKKVAPRLKFEYHAPEKIQGKIVIKPPLSVDLQGRKAWENCLVGYFFEKRVPFHSMEYHANRKWKNRGLTEVIMNDEGFFFFKFQCESDLLEVLEDDACMIEGKPLILQRWHSKIILTKNVPRNIPIWVKIFNIPLQFWNKDGLSRIGSGIGNILIADSLTEKMCKEASGRLSFAKMLIEVDARTELPEELLLHVPSEEFLEPLEVMLRLEYPWRPSWCSSCVTFGHAMFKCPVLGRQQQEPNTGSNIARNPGGENEEFQTVKWKGKDKMGTNNGYVKQGGTNVGSQNYKQNYNRGKYNGNWNEKKGGRGMHPGNSKEKTGLFKRTEGSLIGVPTKNKYNVLIGENDREGDQPIVDEFHLAKSGNLGASTSKSWKDTRFIGKKDFIISPHKDMPPGEVRGVRKDNDVSMELNARVFDYIAKGSELPANQIAMMEKEIEVRETTWDRRVENEGEGICVTNSEVDVDSDLGDTARFMALDVNIESSQELVNQKFNDPDSSREQEIFAVEQLFGDNLLEGGTEGYSKIV